jgi:hypothetical protein
MTGMEFGYKYICLIPYVYYEIITIRKFRLLKHTKKICRIYSKLVYISTLFNFCTGTRILPSGILTPEEEVKSTVSSCDSWSDLNLYPPDNTNNPEIHGWSDLHLFPPGNYQVSLFQSLSYLFKSFQLFFRIIIYFLVIICLFFTL